MNFGVVIFEAENVGYTASSKKKFLMKKMFLEK